MTGGARVGRIRDDGLGSQPEKAIDGGNAKSDILGEDDYLSSGVPTAG